MTVDTFIIIDAIIQKIICSVNFNSYLINSSTRIKSTKFSHKILKNV